MIRPRPCSTPWSPVALALVVLSGVLSVATPAAGQPPGRPNQRQAAPFVEQTHVFRRLLYDLKFQPVTTFGEVNPADTIVVILGTAPPDAESNLADFLQKGGSVLLATDRPLTPTLAQFLVDNTGYKIDSSGKTSGDLPAHFIFNGSPDDCYQGLPFCPFLVPVQQNRAGTLNLFRNPDGRQAQSLRVATNVPSRLVGNRIFPAEGVAVLAKLPAGCENDATHVGAGLNSTMLISWEVPKGGRLLLLADHSIFINEMMLPNDNNNVEFTANCVHWLSVDQTHKKVLFVEDGKINSKFEVPIQEMPFVIPPDLERRIGAFVNEKINTANDHLVDAEEDDLFNHWIDRILRAGGETPWRAMGILFVVLTLVGLVVGFFRLAAHGYRQQQPVAPSLARLVQQQEPAESLMEQRNLGMFKVGNFWEVGRQLARQTFEAAGVTARPGDPLPRVTTQGGYHERRSLHRQVAQLWALAFDTRPQPVSPEQWPALLREVAGLRTALTNGKVRLG